MIPCLVGRSHQSFPQITSSWEERSQLPPPPPPKKVRTDFSYYWNGLLLIHCHGFIHVLHLDSHRFRIGVLSVAKNDKLQASSFQFPKNECLLYFLMLPLLVLSWYWRSLCGSSWWRPHVCGAYPPSPAPSLLQSWQNPPGGISHIASTTPPPPTHTPVCPWQGHTGHKPCKADQNLGGSLIGQWLCLDRACTDISKGRASSGGCFGIVTPSSHPGDSPSFSFFCWYSTKFPSSFTCFHSANRIHKPCP